MKSSKHFADKVRKIVAGIQAGTVLTYGEVARRAGNSKAARAVGAILRTNYDPNIPCHRVVAVDGKLTGYNRGLAKKAALLKKEGALPALAKLKARTTARRRHTVL